MKGKNGLALVSFVFPILVWGIFLIVFTYFRWDLNDSVMSLFEIRSKGGADFNTDSAVMNYLLMSNGRILMFMMFTFAGISSALMSISFNLKAKIRILESELSEIKQKIND